MKEKAKPSEIILQNVKIRLMPDKNVTENISNLLTILELKELFL